MEREDLQTASAIYADGYITHLPFTQLIALLAAFCEQLLLESSFQPQTISTARALLHKTHLYLTGAISAEEFEQSRIDGWSWHDELPGSEQHLARTIVCCLYDEDAAEFDTYGPEGVIETFLSSLLDLGNGYCRQFLAFTRNDDYQRFNVFKAK